MLLELLIFIAHGEPADNKPKGGLKMTAIGCEASIGDTTGVADGPVTYSTIVPSGITLVSIGVLVDTGVEFDP